MGWQDWWVWVVAGVALAVLEVIVPGFVFLGFAIGVTATGLLMLAGMLGSNLAVLILVAAVISLLAWLVIRRVFGLRKGQVKIWHRDINDEP